MLIYKIWIGTNTQEHDDLPLYVISDKVSRPFLVELQVKGNTGTITFEVDTEHVSVHHVKRELLVSFSR